MPNTANTARLRRRRGYEWERKLTNRIDGWPGWSAVRLGDPSTKIPDILAVSENKVVAIECKSTKDKDYLYIPADQIDNTVRFAGMFAGRYEVLVVGAFKFGGDDPAEYGYDLLSICVDGEGARCARDGTIMLQDGTGRYHPPVINPLRFSMEGPSP